MGKERWLACRFRLGSSRFVSVAVFAVLVVELVDVFGCSLLLGFPLFSEICPGIVLRLVLALYWVDFLKNLIEINLIGALERPSFFEPTMATLFHERTSLRDCNSSKA